MNKLMLSVFALAAVVFSASAENNTASLGGTGKVVLTTPLSLEAGTGATGGVLDFGKLNITSAAATCTMATSGTESITAGTVLTAGTPAGYKVTGQINSYFDVTYSTCTLAGVLHPSAQLTVTNFLDNAPTSIAAEGYNIFNVGGDLNIPANAVVDSYTGSFTVTVTYN